jgi:aromatic-L-amino-acid/L-tryptophan decarboxylase
MLDEKDTLDPFDWNDYHALAREMIDATVADLGTLETRTGWRPLGESDKNAFRSPLPMEGAGMRAAYQDFLRFARPFPFGQNTRRFWGWAGGVGTPDGILASLLNAAFHSPVIIHHHAGTWIDIQVLEWMREALGFPLGTKGNLTSGGSLANFTGLAVARHVRGGATIRSKGVGRARFTVYGSSATHYSIPKSLDLLGLGERSFRKLTVNEEFQLDPDLLDAAIVRDKRRGLRPICVVGNAGTVGTGAIDPLHALADVATRHDMWFHIDGAFGAVAAFSTKHRSLVSGMERADSLAFDFHKWLSQPYDAGCVLVANGEALEDTFRFGTSYTAPIPGSLTDSPVVFGNRGPELSRALRGLPLWLSLKTHGARRFGEMVDKNIAQARYLEDLIRAEPRLELLASGPLSVVNYRYRGTRRRSDRVLNDVNARLVAEIQKRSIAIPSSYAIDRKAAIRVCNLNHRSSSSDFDALVAASVSIGEELEALQKGPTARKLHRAITQTGAGGFEPPTS